MTDRLDRSAPRLRPPGRPAGFQRWRTLLFMHWEVDPNIIQATLPDGLEVDTFEGRAFLGVVPFTMRDVAPPWSPSVPGISNFHELNVRTYVVRDGLPGVWFYSLEAASTVAVAIARLKWKLPYFRASMRLEQADDVIDYESRRLFPGPKPATFSARWRVGSELPTPTLGSLEYFLVERYVLFAQQGPRLQVGRVHHAPYRIHAADIEALDEGVTAPLGFALEGAPPLVHYSPGVDVDVYALALA
ncbi:MAG: DUF2071 domain-containing protein [Myxococcota bacterium]